MGGHKTLVSRWFIGSREFAHPWMRWLATPLWRVGVVVVGVSIAVSDHSTWVSLLGVVLVFISLAAYAVDVLVRRRRRDAGLAP
jgi:protein-S-isoprenylcysteine O-methyltransferase Ste14